MVENWGCGWVHAGFSDSISNWGQVEGSDSMWLMSICIGKKTMVHNGTNTSHPVLHVCVCVPPLFKHGNGKSTIYSLHFDREFPASHA